MSNSNLIKASYVLSINNVTFILHYSSFRARFHSAPIVYLQSNTSTSCSKYLHRSKVYGIYCYVQITLSLTLFCKNSGKT